ncbi:MAG: hypothetical protein EBY28_18590 [Betaproteobacteria bacterium]|nr:hypothetical protein [Betaproteobacteria bacterium]
MAAPASASGSHARRLLTLATAALGGLAATQIGLPLPWVLAMLAGFGAPQPAQGRRLAQVIIGTALGLTFTQEVIREVLSLGGDSWRIRFAVANAGYLPSYVTKRALERKTVRGVVFELHPPAGLALQTGKLRVEGGQLEGHAPKSSLQAFAPNREVTADRAVVEWVVSAPRGTRVAMTATADRAGTVRAEVTLG